MLKLSPSSTALILVDLQHGVVPLAKSPRSGADVVKNAKALARRFREARALVVLVRVSFSKTNMPSQNVDKPGVPPQGTPSEYSRLVPDLEEDGDLVVLKHHWGAFTGTDLDLQLRRRGCQTLVIGGIATNMGVESTARSAWELSYDVVGVEDLTATASAEMQSFALKNIFPNIARVVSSNDVQF